MLTLLFISMIIGLILGLTGAGGSVFAVPLLILLAGFPMNTAVGVSLGAVAASTIYGSLRNWRHRQIIWLPGIVLAITGAVVAPAGKWLGFHLPEQELLIGFNVLALVIALRMWKSAYRNPDAAKVVRGSNFSGTPSPGLICNLSKTGQFELRPRCLSGLILGGVIVGLLSGLFGVGGGFLIVPLLVTISPLTMAQAVSTSLVIIAAVSTSGFISHILLSQNINWTDLAIVGLGGIIGMMIGQATSHRIANSLLQKIFAVSLILVSVISLVFHR